MRVLAIRGRNLASLAERIPDGATLQSTGTLRDRRSISFMVKGTSPSYAAANRCSTVLVEPPMAMSRLIAFSKALKFAMLRGSTLASSCS